MVTLSPLRGQPLGSPGGVGIHPGDYIFADPSGAVAIPANDVRTVLQGACQVSVEDTESIAAIRDETPSTSSAKTER